MFRGKGLRAALLTAVTIVTLGVIAQSVLVFAQPGAAEAQPAAAQRSVSGRVDYIGCSLHDAGLLRGGLFTTSFLASFDADRTLSFGRISEPHFDDASPVAANVREGNVVGAASNG